MSIYLEQNERDSSMYEIYSDKHGQRILWGVIHEDALGYLEGDYTFEQGNGCIKIIGTDA